MAFGPHGLAGGTLDTPQVQHAGLWRDGVPHDTGIEGFVADISPRGDVLVTSRIAATILKADGTRVKLRGLGGSFAIARRLDVASDAAGSAEAAHGIEHPVVWRAPEYKPFVLRIPKGYDQAFLQGVNNRGDTAGAAYTNGDDGIQTAFRWHHRRPEALPDGLGGQANVIDDRGVAAGVGVEGGVLPGTGLPAVWVGSTQRVSVLSPVLFAGWFGTNGQGDFVGFTFNVGDPLPDQHAIIGRTTGRPRALVALSGDPRDRSIAHAASPRHGGDIDVGGVSIGRDRTHHPTIWHCAYAQSIDPSVALGS
jgi:hypothetical protein